VLASAAVAAFAADISVAVAQSSSCARLESTLETLERNSEFRNGQAAERQLRDLSRAVQQNESRYVRDGCNDDAKAGRRLTPQCQALGRDILRAREDVKALERSVGTGNAIAQQREAVLQEYARFGCGGGSQARVIREQGRGNLFDQLFGGFGSEDEGYDGEGGIREDSWGGYGSYHTVRTLCVRKSDGFYWPISYSTLTEYVANDADQCAAQCPGVDVELYYHDNPGQEPEQMINMWGEPYSALPNAFRFRTEFDKTNSCKQQVDYGKIELAQTGDGQSRAMITFNNVTFPLPLRDPRRATQVTQATLEVADYVDVPLPRRRPDPDSDEPEAVAVAPASSQETTRIVQFGEKRVRVVGPDTPYAPSAATGT
jgi:hypothetical protein